MALESDQYLLTVQIEVLWVLPGHMAEQPGPVAGNEKRQVGNKRACCLPSR